MTNHDTRILTHDEKIELIKAQGLYHHFCTGLIDFPWSECQTGKRGAANHYDVMPAKRGFEMPLDALFAEDAHMYAWFTAATWRQCNEMLEHWGFSVKNILTWCKSGDGLSLGRYFRNNAEYVLFAVRGKCPTQFKAQPNWFFAPRQDHSHKPEELFAIIERMSPGPYLELFARRQPTSARPEDWSVWGNEIASDLYIPGFPVPKYSDKAILPSIEEELIYG